MFEGFGMLNSVFQIGEQFGKSPDEVVEFDTATFLSIVIWNAAKSTYQENLTKIKNEKK